MNKRGKLILLAGFLSIGIYFLGSPSVQAAACTNVSSFGAVDLQLPELSNTKDQAVWVRMQGNLNDRVLVEINETDCYEIKFEHEDSGLWFWQTVLDGQEKKLISFSQHSGNRLKIIGLSGGIKVDRVLITDENCVPQDFGDNCHKGVTATSATEPHDYTAIASPAGEVSDKLHISPTVQNSDIKEVSYTVAGRLIQKDSSAREFDTTLLENGKHTVYITSTLSDGTTVRERISLQVKNPENALTPVVRWLKLHSASIRIIALVLLVLAMSMIVAKFVRGAKRSKRERTFRGL